MAFAVTERAFLIHVIGGGAARAHGRAMARYFIHIQNDEFVSDSDGRDMLDLAAARSAMVRSAGAILSSDLHDGKTRANFTLFLEDEEHSELMWLKVDAALSGDSVLETTAAGGGNGAHGKG